MTNKRAFDRAMARETKNNAVDLDRYLDELMDELMDELAAENNKADFQEDEDVN